MFARRQGKPTEAMQDHECLQYGQLDSRDYVAGADALADAKDGTRAGRPLGPGRGDGGGARG